jgi:hypothetical protein
MPRPLFIPGKTRYPLYRRLGGSHGRSGQVRKFSLPLGIRSRDRPARSLSLYPLRHTAHVYRRTLSLTSVFDETGVKRHAPVALYSRKRPGSHFTEGWVGFRTGLDRCGYSRHPPILDPGTVQPVAIRYTDYATRPTCISFLFS